MPKQGPQTPSSIPETYPRSWIPLTQRLLDSYHGWLGHNLIPRDGTPSQQAATLFDAPFVVVAHGTEPDPILCYANRCALDLWEFDIPTLLGTPSRLTAEPIHRDERGQLLARTTRDGFVDDYRGIRVSRSGRRFLIERAVVWNLRDEHGNYCGQAATFSSWGDLDAIAKQ